jgi:hypothetical protein
MMFGATYFEVLFHCLFCSHRGVQLSGRLPFLIFSFLYVWATKQQEIKRAEELRCKYRNYVAMFYGDAKYYISDFQDMVKYATDFTDVDVRPRKRQKIYFSL